MKILMSHGEGNRPELRFPYLWGKNPYGKDLPSTQQTLTSWATSAEERPSLPSSKGQKTAHPSSEGWSCSIPEDPRGRPTHSSSSKRSPHLRPQQLQPVFSQNFSPKA